MRLKPNLDLARSRKNMPALFSLPLEAEMKGWRIPIYVCPKAELEKHHTRGARFPAVHKEFFSNTGGRAGERPSTRSH